MSCCDNFKFIHRGFENNILFLSGWAFDYRIFKSLDLPFNYIFTLNSYLKPDFFEDFFLFINANKINSFSILGWSMGGFFVAELLEKFQNTVVIPSVYLLNIRSYFYEDEIEEKKIQIKKDRVNTLKEFYKFVFLGHRKQYQIFKEELEGDYLKNFCGDELADSLNYLRNKPIDLSFAGHIKTIIIQGSLDKLVLPEMYPKIPENRNISSYILKTGHLSFFSQEFKEILSN
jgi:pimeloyl-ACP methyl ester carboxylesterase